MVGTVGLLFLGRKRPGFDQEWGRTMERAVRAAVSDAGYEFVGPSAVDEAGLREALTEFLGIGVDVLLVLQTTMSDGRLAPTLMQQWPGPVVLWATPERPEGDRVSACSLVGAHTFAATIRQLGGRFELVYGMPGQPETTARLDQALRVAHAARRLPRCRAGLIGAHAPGFIDMATDASALAKGLGVHLRHFGLDELLNAVAAVPEAAVHDDLRQVLAMKLPLVEITEDDLRTASRTYLALRALAAEEHLDLLAVRDWPELPERLGQWPHLAVVRLLNEGFPIACEGDLDGALSLLAGNLLGCGAGAVCDWLEHDGDTLTLWHAGDAPFALCEPVGSPGGPSLGRHFNNRKPLVVNATLRAGEPVTVFRLWRCDGEYRATAFEGETLPPRRTLLGDHGLVRTPGVDCHDRFDALCHAGMPHHVVLLGGHHSRLLRRFARQAGLRWTEDA